MTRAFLLNILFLLLAGSLSGEAAPGIIKGKVTDQGSGEALPGVYVLYGKNSGVVTDDQGMFSVQLTPGKYTIIFQLVGYETQTREVNLKDGETIEVQISLAMNVREIDQVVVSANRTEQKITELSVSMDIVKSAFIEANHITDAQEIINKTPGIEVLDGQASVRGGSGFSYGAGSRVLALIDGLPMLSADAGNIKWQFLPLENLSQIEIIKGASSVMYGSSALNGVINFRTADATNTPSTTFFVESGIYGKPSNRDWIWWDTPRTFSNASFSHLRKAGKTDIGISGSLMIDESYRRLNDEKLGRLGIKLKHFSTKVPGLTYGLNINSGLTHKKDFVLWENATTGALKQSPSTAVDFRGDFLAIDPFVTLKKTGKFQHDLRTRVQSSRNRNPERPQNDSDAWSVYSEYQLWHHINEIIDLTAGFSVNYLNVSSQFFGDHNARNLAAFSQIEVKPVPRLKAVAGIRAEQYSLDNINDRIVPIFRAGLNYQAADYTWIRASFGQGYRYPSIAEKFAATTVGSIVIIANPDLRSESGWSSEIGVKQGVALGKIAGQADLSVFYNRNSDLIEYLFAAYEEGLGFRAANLEESRVIGAEIECMLEGSIGPVNTSITGGYTWLDPVELSPNTKKPSGDYLKYRRKNSGKISLTAEKNRLEATASFYVKSKILNIDDVFLTTPILVGFGEYWPTHNKGYTLIDCSAGYKISKKLTLSFVVKNITNTEYMGRPGDIQPQRNFSIRLSGKI